MVQTVVQTVVQHHGWPSLGCAKQPTTDAIHLLLCHPHVLTILLVPALSPCADTLLALALQTYKVVQRSTGREYACKTLAKTKISCPEEEEDIRVEVGSRVQPAL